MSTVRSLLLLIPWVKVVLVSMRVKVDARLGLSLF